MRVYPNFLVVAILKAAAVEWKLGYILGNHAGQGKPSHYGCFSVSMELSYIYIHSVTINSQWLPCSRLI